MGTVTPEMEARAGELLDRLSLPEKVWMLSGDLDFYDEMVAAGPPGRQTRRLHRAAGVPRLGLGGLSFTDGPRGVSVGASTCFPVAMARAATFDYELEERVGGAIGREARAQGANLVGAPCVNLLRHPAWGRAQETYGEDSDHIGAMGAAFVRGLQKHAMACVKHFACNSVENSRFKLDVRVTREVLETVYLPHFERIVREGVAGVMSAYNAVNGEWCGQNRQLLTGILKDRWGFDGFVVSDWVFGIRDGVKALNAGLDLEMPSRHFFGERALKGARRGEIPLERVNEAALALIRQQLRFADVGEGSYGPEVVACAEHRALAREVATRAIVLLRNAAVDGKPVLPFAPEEVRRLAVIGRLAAVPNTGDLGSSNVTPPYVVTPLEGLKAALEPLGVEVVYEDGADLGRAASAAAAADAALVVTGYDYRDEGELMGGFLDQDLRALLPRPKLRQLPKLALKSRRLLRGDDFGDAPRGGDRDSLTLHREDEELLLAVAAANRRTAVALMCGSAVLMERWREWIPGILVLWYPGMEGGHALADIVLGKRSPTGRLPFTIPTSEDHLPFFDAEATTIEYGPLHGQALLDDLGVPAAYPFGFGLTYQGAI